MAKENNFIYFEDVKIVRKKDSYVVTFEMEDCSFYIKVSEIEEIATKNDEEEVLIATILAYIEYARKCRNSDKNPKAKRLEEEKVASGISDLLRKYSIETIIDFFKELKWYEMCEIIQSDDPIGKIEEII